MKREYELCSKCTSDSLEEVYSDSNNSSDFHYYKKSFIENGTLDDMFDFE